MNRLASCRLSRPRRGARAEARATVFEDGFTLVDMLMTVALMGIVAAVSIPGMRTAIQQYEIRAAVRSVATQAHSARLKAVTSRRVMRVRFNCPAAGQFRVVEITTVGAIDNAADRCSDTTYPYPDRNQAAAPDFDGPVLFLPQATTFAAATDFDFDLAGRMTPVGGGFVATIQINNASGTQTITVSAAGRIQVP